MDSYDLRIDGRFATDEEAARLIQLLREKNINTSRPIRHWTIDFVREQHDAQEEGARRSSPSKKPATCA